MIAIALLFVRFLCDCFKSRRRLEAEILVLRHQLNVLHRRAPRRLYMTWADRALFAWLYRGLPCILEALAYRPCKRSCDIKCLLSHRKQLPGIRQCRHAPSRRCPEGQAWRRTQVSRLIRQVAPCARPSPRASAEFAQRSERTRLRRLFSRGISQCQVPSLLQKIQEPLSRSALQDTFRQQVHRCLAREGSLKW